MAPGLHVAVSSRLHLQYSQQNFSGGETMLHYMGEEPQPVDCFLALPPDHLAFLYIKQGSGALTVGDSTRVIASGQTVTLEAGPEALLKVGRFAQDWYLFLAPETYFHGIKLHASERFGMFQGGSPHVRRVEACPLATYCAPDSESNLSQVYVWATIQFAGESDGMGSTLVHPFMGQGSPFEALLVAVRQAPSESWSLQRAADMVGYSTFHFSRTFRAVTKLGFPDYVDRARTDFALERILTTNDSIEEIAEQSGFGRPVSLRSALKEHLGLLPSELRH